MDFFGENVRIKLKSPVRMYAEKAAMFLQK